MKGKMTLAEYQKILLEIQNQPSWRSAANRVMDFVDGNQLDSEILQKQKELGIPPATENVMGEVFDNILGMEAKQRRDWKVISNGGKDGDLASKALGFKLNLAERESHADQAIGAAYAPQVKIGIGWVEVSREPNPFKYPYRCRAVPRNEIFWDMKSIEPDLSDANWLLRKKWFDRYRLEALFPKQKELIQKLGTGNYEGISLSADGWGATGLSMSENQDRGFTVEEQDWRDEGRLSLVELWYRIWAQTLVLKLPEGRVVEYQKDNPFHMQALSLGAELISANVDKMRRAWIIGPCILADEKSPYPGSKFPYVPFFGKIEDMTHVPFGLGRDMVYLQEEVNARISKQQWLLSARRIVRTENVALMSDEEIRTMAARPDGDFILDAQAMKNGGVFKIESDFALNAEQARRLNEARAGILRAGRVTDAFQGRNPGDQSGTALTAMIEQTVQGLADIGDNLLTARTEVGERLLSFIIEDIGDKEERVLVSGGLLREDVEVVLNQSVFDEESKTNLLDNDIQRMEMKVVLEDVPSTPSFRTQQLQSMTEAFKSSPAQVQMIALPHLLNLMDVPNKDEIISAVKDMSKMPTEEEIKNKIQSSVEAALMKANIGLKERELDIKERISAASIGKMSSEEVSNSIDALYSAVQAAREMLATPGIAPVADQVAKSAGFRDRDAPPIYASPAARRNTSPMFPPRVQAPEIPEPTVSTPEQPVSPDIGAKEGIEAPGTIDDNLSQEE